MDYSLRANGIVVQLRREARCGNMTCINDGAANLFQRTSFTSSNDNSMYYTPAYLAAFSQRLRLGLPCISASPAAHGQDVRQQVTFPGVTGEHEILLQ
jgi:hypothetical protein